MSDDRVEGIVERVEWGRVDMPFNEEAKWQLRVALVFGWRFEASVVCYNRWRLAVVGGGLHLGEPWGYDGALWSLNVRLYAFGLSIGLRGPAPEPPQIEPDEWDDESDAAIHGEVGG